MGGVKVLPNRGEAGLRPRRAGLGLPATLRWRRDEIDAGVRMGWWWRKSVARYVGGGSAGTAN